MSKRRIVVATADTIGVAMAGPAIRALAIAHALSADHDVRVVTTEQVTISRAGFEIRSVDVEGLVDAAQWCDVFIVQGWVLAGRPNLQRALQPKIVVADLYDPMHLEQLEQGRDAGADGWRAAVNDSTAVLNEQIRRADWFLCASDRQRDFWLGALASLGRVNPATYDADPTLRSLIDVVPFGVADEPPTRTGPGWRGVQPGIGDNDRLLLWGGGLWNWFDPLTLLRAVAALRDDVPNVRLVFMGLTHPNPGIPRMRMAVQARALSDELGLTDRHAFFNEGWVDYDARQNYLLDADVGVSTHFDHVEAEFAYRTRVLDYLWAGLPVVMTRGDALAELVEREELGCVVPPADVDALTDALRTVLTNDEFRARCAKSAAAAAIDMRWSEVVQPLVAFCRQPVAAPDRVDEQQARVLRRAPLSVPSRIGARATARRLYEVMLHPSRALNFVRRRVRTLWPGRSEQLHEDEAT
jgi:glycosyltransferase involved in cell wall biosynthesis